MGFTASIVIGNEGHRHASGRYNALKTSLPWLGRKMADHNYNWWDAIHSAARFVAPTKPGPLPTIAHARTLRHHSGGRRN